MLMVHDECPGVHFISCYASHDDGGVVKVIAVWAGVPLQLAHYLASASYYLATYYLRDSVSCTCVIVSHTCKTKKPQNIYITSRALWVYMLRSLIKTLFFYGTAHRWGSSIHPLLELFILVPVSLRASLKNLVCSDWSALTGLRRYRPLFLCTNSAGVFGNVAFYNMGHLIRTSGVKNESRQTKRRQKQ